ncbi:MAG: hypothetical protein ACI82F_004699 [Planctomycetota bacterium]|jgi:hypothetical protein
MCTLRIYTPDIDADALTELCPLKPSSVFRKGEPRNRSNAKRGIHTASGICVPVSDAEWTDLPGQVVDAIQFLTQHESWLKQAGGLSGLSWFVLDFPIKLRIGENEIVAQTDSFPPEFLRLAGNLGLGLELTTYE